MELKAHYLRTLTNDSGKCEVTFETDHTAIGWLKEHADKDLKLDVKEYRERRSLNANAYAWVLINGIANAVRQDKDKVYQDFLKHYGQSDMVSVKSEINVAPYFKYYEVAGQSKLNGTDFTHYRIFKGSSEFDTNEMSIFIDGIVEEAKALGIETRTPEELAEIKSLWATEK